MSEDTIDLIMQRKKGDPKLVARYLMSLMNAALISVRSLLRTDLPNAARSYAQSYVSAVVRQDAGTQLHLGGKLGLQMNQSVMEQ